MRTMWSILNRLPNVELPRLFLASADLLTFKAVGLSDRPRQDRRSRPALVA
jgi:hypothetical protein